MDKEELELCSEVIKSFDHFQYTGSVSDMVKYTMTLQRFARMLDKHRRLVGAADEGIKVIDEEQPIEGADGSSE